MLRDCTIIEYLSMLHSMPSGTRRIIMQINLKLQNLVIIVGFVATVVLCFLYDLQVLANMPPGEVGSFMSLRVLDAWQSVFLFTAAVAAVLLLGVAFRYNKIRKHKSNAYLSSLIFYSAIYQGLGYALYVLQTLFTSGNSANAIVQIGFKMYLPLGILALLFFAFMAMEVFVKPTITHGKENRLEVAIQALQAFGIVIGIIVVLFVYTPNGGLIEMIMGAAGFTVFGIIVLIVVYVIVRIFKIRHSTIDPVQWTALRAIAIQLLLLLAVTMLMVQVEMASFTMLPYEPKLTFSIAQSGLSMLIALLYFPAFISPSEKQHASQEMAQ